MYILHFSNICILKNKNIVKERSSQGKIMGSKYSNKIMGRCKQKLWGVFDI